MMFCFPGTEWMFFLRNQTSWNLSLPSDQMASQTPLFEVEATDGRTPFEGSKQIPRDSHYSCRTKTSA